MPDEKVVETSERQKTASQLLIEVMEGFGESEPRGILVLYTNEAGELNITANVGRSESIGLLEIAKWMMLP